MRLRRATAPVIAALILFGIVFSVGTTYFYSINSQQRTYEQNLLQNDQKQNQLIQSASNLLVYGTVISGQVLLFTSIILDPQFQFPLGW